MAIGKKTGGGSRKGSPNKSTQARKKAIAEAGLMPLDFFLQTLRDASQPYDKRFAAATSAAPYLHPRLASTTLKGDDAAPIAIAITERIIDPKR